MKPGHTLKGKASHAAARAASSARLKPSINPYLIVRTLLL